MTNTNLKERYDLIIIGSGIAGLSAAYYATKAGQSVLIVDKGRRIGGRCSTKRAGSFTFNHGAQFFTTKDADFTNITLKAKKAGAVQLWDFGHHSPAYGGAPTMRDFPSYLLSETQADIIQDCQIMQIKRYQSDKTTEYKLTDQNDTNYHSHKLIITSPAPQASQLLASVEPELAKTAQTASYEPCWTAMFAIDDMKEVQCNPLRDSGPIGWANYEPARDPNSYLPALTIQANPKASQDMLSWDADAVCETLRDAYERATNTSLIITNQLAHRWLYARVAQSADETLPFANDDHSLALAGDYFGTARLESAFISGRRAATALL